MKMRRHFIEWIGRLSRFFVFAFIFASIINIGVNSFLWLAEASAQGPEKAFLHRHDPRVQEAMAIQNKHLWSLMRIPDVVGAGLGIGPDGQPVIKVFTARPGVPGIPEWLESVPVRVQVTGMVVAQDDTTARYRPAPIGVSTGHPAITAGTIGARVKDGAGHIFALSNNHVYANQNEASIGDSVLQPGPYDGGAYPGDVLGTLQAFEPIDFTLTGVNYMDAAIALSSSDALGNSTLPDGYGVPGSEVVEADLGLPVKKYGRTTGLTNGRVSEINVFVEVCYEQFWIVCIKSAYFYDQIAISPAVSGTEFSAGGDSGSLIVTENGNYPVGLLFAGGTNITFANQIDRVLSRLGVTIDGRKESTPPAPPGNLTATPVSGSQINLAWTDNSQNESGFEIQRCMGSGCSDFEQLVIVSANTTSYPDKKLLPSTIYTYRVRAYNSAGSSEFSNVTSAETLAVVEPPEAPRNLLATVSGRTKVDLSWDDTSNIEDGFKIERCKGSRCTNFAQIATVGANVTSYSDTNVRRRTTYTYRVRAYNSAGNSEYSNSAEAKTY